MNDKVKELSYPIVSFGRKKVIHFSRSESELTTCSRRGYKNGYYNNLLLVDSTGKSIVVKEANKIGYAGPYWGFDLFKGRRIRVEFKFTSEFKFITLDEFKFKIVDVLNDDKYFWNSDGELEKRKSFIKNARTHEEIIKYMANNFYKEF